jgi:hypothetical protein
MFSDHFWCMGYWRMERALAGEAVKAIQAAYAEGVFY